jgi:TRAP-type C4-dicarboxylate transport system substrate-binding protein
VRAAAPNATLWMQLYVMSDRAIAERVVRRARTAGFEALVLTVDVPVSGLRERDLRHGFRVPMHLTPGTLCDMARHPAWLLRLARAGMPKFANLLPDDDGAPVSAQAQAALLSRAMDRTLTWDSLTWLRRLWDGPLLIKGLLGAEDARRAVRHGADGIVVSNHGGRQLDAAPASIAALPAIVDAVGGRIPVLAVQAQDKPVALKLSSWVPAQHALNPALQAWADDIKKQSNGTITPRCSRRSSWARPSTTTTWRATASPTSRTSTRATSRAASRSSRASSLPFMVSNAKAGSAAIDAWYRQYAAKEMKDVHFCFAFVHDPGALHSRKKVLLPTEIKGMKIRPATSTIGQMVTTLGGTNVQSSAPEARDMLERGVAEAITFPWGSLNLFGIDKVVKYHMDVPLYVTPFVWVMNKDKYNAMSAAQKKVIDDHCTSEWAEKVGSAWADFEIAGRAKIAAEAGHEVYKLTPDQLGAWRTRCSRWKRSGPTA